MSIRVVRDLQLYASPGLLFCTIGASSVTRRSTSAASCATRCWSPCRATPWPRRAAWCPASSASRCAGSACV